MEDDAVREALEPLEERFSIETLARVAATMAQQPPSATPRSPSRGGGRRFGQRRPPSPAGQRAARPTVPAGSDPADPA